jgi:hypothetical protein
MIACAHTLRLCTRREVLLLCAAHPENGAAVGRAFSFSSTHIHNKFVRSDENERMPAQAFPGGVIEKVTTESCVKKHMRSPHTPGQL